jgi:SAM-dependent methyltransferase
VSDTGFSVLALAPEPCRHADRAGTVAPMRLTDAISLRSRRRKLRLFLDELSPTAETTVLDAGADELGFAAGGGCQTLNFFEELYPWPERITALGLHDGAGFRERYPAIRYVQGDACALPFPDASFDAYFSNAVIEHVGDEERRRALVDEALRVARRAFITTPNRWFPLEVHTRLPLVHWLPERLAHRAYDLAGKGWAKENHLLGPGELRQLFPVPVRIVNLGLTLVAIT